VRVATPTIKVCEACGVAIRALAAEILRGGRLLNEFS
jgi:hypothetical protein